jgi:hypothetical protein
LHSRFLLVLTSLGVSLGLGTSAAAGAFATTATTSDSAPTLDVRGDFDYKADTEFGVSWSIVYPEGMDPSGWSTYCSVDGSTESECTPDSLNATTLPEGSHTIEITPRNTTEAGSGETYVWEFVVDVTPPEAMEYDDTLLARMGEDVVLPRMFEDALSPITLFHCFSDTRDDLFPQGIDHVVLPSPDGGESFLEGYHCHARDSRGLPSEYAKPHVMWDADKPWTYLSRRLPGLLTDPVWFRMVGDDFDTAWAGEPMRIFGKYRILTPRMEWRRWKRPDRWVTTRHYNDAYHQVWRRGFRLTQVPRGHHVCVRVGARDAVGLRHVSKRSCATRAWDDRDLRRSDGWRERSPRGAYRGTALVTRRYGATLKLTRPSQGRGANILVRKCPDCGSIRFSGPDNPYWGVRNLTYSLRAKRTRWAKIPVDWQQRLYEGNYTIKVISSGKPVMIDGLAVTPWRLRNDAAWTRQAQNY